jgi:hypothetical protein
MSFSISTLLIWCEGTGTAVQTGKTAFQCLPPEIRIALQPRHTYTRRSLGATLTVVGFATSQETKRQTPLSSFTACC